MIVLFIIVATTVSADTASAKAAPKSRAAPTPAPEQQTMRDMAVGTDDEDDFYVSEDTEKKLEQLLASRKVEIPVKRLQPARSGMSRETDHHRI
jgi:hypothetical protein